MSVCVCVVFVFLCPECDSKECAVRYICNACVCLFVSVCVGLCIRMRMFICEF